MRNVGNVLLKGLAAVLPVGLTLYLIYWLAITIEEILHPVMAAVVPGPLYLPGMGLAAGLLLLYFIGLAVNAWVVRRLIHVGENILERIPLVKSVYGTLRDFMDYFSTTQQRRDLRQVVLVSVADTRMLGFITEEHIEDMPGITLPEDTVAVYLPMSYQIGGYTLYLPRSKVEPLDISIEDAMRRVLTAGLSKPARKRRV